MARTSRRNPAAALAAASLALAAASVVAVTLDFLRGGNVGASSPRPAPRATLLLEGEDGLPRSDLLVVGSDGRDLVPDDRGMLGLPASDGSRTFEVLDRSTRRWLRALTVQPGSSGIVRIEVPR